MGVNELMQQDIDSRESIVLDMSRNFFVEAGAGSGKTTMLVRRMVAMVEAGIDVSRICAITFTKAAAGEFYDRFQKLLAERSIAPTKQDFMRKPGELQNPTDESRKRCHDALQNIDLCFMGTIDSFCNMVLSEHPAEAMIPSNAGIVSDDDIKEIYTREYLRMLKKDEAYSSEICELAQEFNKLNGRKANDVFSAGMNAIMDIRHTEIILPEVPASLNALIENDRKDLLYILRKLENQPEAAQLGNVASRDAWDTIDDSIAVLESNPEDDI